MDERQWSKARNLASAYSEAYDEDVAHVLGEALLEALAELMVPEGERGSTDDRLSPVRMQHDYDEQVAEAKAQHPAYLPSVGIQGLPWVMPHPEFLEGEEAYAAAPVGTIAGAGTTGEEFVKINDGTWDGSLPGYRGMKRTPFRERPVKRWGYGD